MKSYDHFNKNVNLPPPKNTNELKFSKSYFLPITHLMTKFQRPTTSWKNVKQLVDTLGIVEGSLALENIVNTQGTQRHTV